MRFVIMADGKGSRWNNYMGIPKHLIEIDGESLQALCNIEYSLL